jgi:hypothetical protein
MFRRMPVTQGEARAIGEGREGAARGRTMVSREEGTSGRQPGRAGFFARFRWEADMTLPIVAALSIVLGWYLVVNYEVALRSGTAAAFCKTQLEIARSLARSAENLTRARLGSMPLPEIESLIRSRILAPVNLPGGGAWMVSPEHTGCENDAGLPWCAEGRAALAGNGGNGGAMGMERLAADVSAGREGAGRFVSGMGERQEIIAWAPARVDGFHVVVGVTASFTDLLSATGVTRQSRNAMLMMGLMTLGGLGLVILSAGNIVRRRRAELALERANAELEARVARRTEELAAKTKALLESRLRERLSEKEAEIAFQAGLVESAGTYLHTTGNALTSLEGLFLKTRRTLEAVARTREAFQAARQAAARAEGAAPDAPAGPAAQAVGDLETAILDRAVPRLSEALEEMAAVKARMIEDLERGRTQFESRRERGRLVQPVDLGHVLAEIAEELRPQFETRDLVLTVAEAPGVVAQTGRRRVAAGLASCLALVRDAALFGQAGEVFCRALRGPDGRVRVVVRARGAAFLGADPSRDDPELLAFINFLNENHGVFGIVRDSEGFSLEVELGDAPAQP